MKRMHKFVVCRRFWILTMPALVSVEICICNVYVNVLTLGACEGPIFNTVAIHSLK
jgi:hypothetical protein